MNQPKRINPNKLTQTKRLRRANQAEKNRVDAPVVATVPVVAIFPLFLIVFPQFQLDTWITVMRIHESMHSLFVSYDYIGSYITQNMEAKTEPKVAKIDTSTPIQIKLIQTNRPKTTNLN